MKSFTDRYYNVKYNQLTMIDTTVIFLYTVAGSPK